MINTENSKLMKKQSKISSKNYFNQNNLYTNNKVNLEAVYFVAGPNMEMNRVTSAKTTIKIYNEFSDMSKHIECFKGTFLPKVTKKCKAKQSAIKTCNICTTKTVWKDLERIQEQQILTSLGVD